MPLFSPSLVRYAAASTSTPGSRIAAREALRARSSGSSSSTSASASPAYPTIPTCPAPSCPCAETPPDLDIERKIDLNGTMAPYAEHVVIPTGQDDWKSKIEDERDTAPWGEFTAGVKDAIGSKGEFFDPYHNIVVSTSSFSQPTSLTSPPTSTSSSSTTSALLFPSFKVVHEINPSSKSNIADFIRTFLLPQTLHPSYASMSEDQKKGKTRDITNLTSGYWKGKVHPISTPTILICSHNSRDSRCGVLGPLLHAEFTSYINKRASLSIPNPAVSEENTQKNGRGNATPKSHTYASHPEFKQDFIDNKSDLCPVNVGMISHIGGHKFAGNVIVYIPPDYPGPDQDQSQSQNQNHGNGNGTSDQEVYIKQKGKGEGEYQNMHSKQSVDPKFQRQILKDEKNQSKNTEGNGDESINLDLDFVSDGLHPLAGKGIWYGRVEPRHVEGIVEQTVGKGNIIRELFRGGVNADGSGVRIGLY